MTLLVVVKTTLPSTKCCDNKRGYDKPNTDSTYGLVLEISPNIIIRLFKAQIRFYYHIYWPDTIFHIGCACILDFTGK